uniref:F-box domain-containing protein n=1 Tax=Cryptomonas curvata TaxID=233186 RepID=A0A7S0MX94_9CRYP|mmetsp:Transcript_56725/g.118606  ORF Transcript_56725/g.118606 Transcript_56725/m.118606 type:complete len:229 (+) Transcript_56725:94-780(+)
MTAAMHSEITFNVFEQIADHKTLSLCRRVNKQWNRISSLNCVWEDKCRKLWSKKVYVPERYRILLAQGKAQEALKGSILDSRRSAITIEEFSGMPFFFRFKRAAGRYWTDMDPYWQNDEPICMKFNQNGPIDGLPEVQWKFAVEAGATCLACRSSQINVSVKDTSVLVYEVLRHSNWGFIIQNQWVLYASFPFNQEDDRLLDEFLLPTRRAPPPPPAHTAVVGDSAVD